MQSCVTPHPHPTFFPMELPPPMSPTQHPPQSLNLCLLSSLLRVVNPTQLCFNEAENRGGRNRNPSLFSPSYVFFTHNQKRGVSILYLLFFFFFAFYPVVMLVIRRLLSMCIFIKIAFHPIFLKYERGEKKNGITMKIKRTDAFFCTREVHTHLWVWVWRVECVCGGCVCVCVCVNVLFHTLVAGKNFFLEGVVCV